MSQLTSMMMYFLILLLIGYMSYQKQISSTGFMIGNRSLNSWLTALSAHASDMSSWLFLAYPAAIFTHGISACAAGAGLIGCMLINWQFIAPKLRRETEKVSALTLSSFFEKKLGDTSGYIRLFSACILTIFYTIYISAFLTGLADLLTSMFPISRLVAIFIGISMTIPYVVSGGFVTLAWIDLFQALFLLVVILFVPFYLLYHMGGLESFDHALNFYQLSQSLIPHVSLSMTSLLSLALGWGLGYFGQPHILTKFMGIKEPSHLSRSKWIGMSWMTLSLTGATLTGLIGILFFHGHLQNPETLFIEMVKQTFPSFFVGLILCAVFGATINAMSSQILVLTSTLTEDFYKKFLQKNSSSSELLKVSRIGVLIVSGLACLLAYCNISSIYLLVNYAWSGIGASFGPLLIACLYYTKITRNGAWAGMIFGALTSAIWPFFNDYFFEDTLFPLIPAFIMSFIMIFGLSYLSGFFSSRPSDPAK